MHSNLNSATGDRTSDGSFGHDSYTDVALDAGYQFLGDGTHIATVDGIFTHESQNLRGSLGMGASSQASNHLDQIRVNLSYWFQNTYGLNFGWQNTWGNANPALYAPAPVTGSANGKPGSNSFVVEADWVPFGVRNTRSIPASMEAAAITTASAGTRAATTRYSSSPG